MDRDPAFISTCLGDSYFAGEQIISLEAICLQIFNISMNVSEFSLQEDTVRARPTQTKASAALNRAAKPIPSLSLTQQPQHCNLAANASTSQLQIEFVIKASTSTSEFWKSEKRKFTRLLTAIRS